ncbi:hypothetical protein WMY93_033762, partial [Mugilogobius chulae]
ASSVTSVGRRDAMLQAAKQLTPEKDHSAVASEGQDLQSLENLTDKSFDTGEKTFSCDHLVSGLIFGSGARLESVLGERTDCSSDPERSAPAIQTLSF